MRKYAYHAGLGLAIGLALLLQINGVQAAGAAAPTAVFPEKKYMFDPVLEGTEIKHDFIVENQGEAALTINKVQPD